MLMNKNTFLHVVSGKPQCQIVHHVQEKGISGKSCEFVKNLVNLNIKGCTKLRNDYRRKNLNQRMHWKFEEFLFEKKKKGLYKETVLILEALEMILFEVFCKSGKLSIRMENKL